jgi:phospholipid-transporting ATPase
MVLVIDGKCLNFALDKTVSKTFLHLAIMCKSVICCRVTPLQKALVVKLVRDNVSQCITLAIGDGANDVTMIQAANVGIGISGQEGLQAARSSDFAIGQFRFLSKLLLVHGLWAYHRISRVIVFSFYKNITLYLIQLWFATTNGFSGQTLFETWSSISSYNVAWTLLSPLAIGIFDQFVNAKQLLSNPKLYKLGQTNSFYNNFIFFQWIAESIIHSVMIFFLWTVAYGEAVILTDGRSADNWAFGQMVYATVLFTVLIKTCLTIYNWVNFSFFAVFGSFVAFFVLFPIVF